jgi:four helix bundle protein
MQNQRLPHHKLLAYGVAVQLMRAVREAKIRDPYLRDHAMRAAKSACLNTAEGAGRVSRADKARAFTIARGEACEAAACVEIAVEAGDAEVGALGPVVACADRFVARTTALIR